jgi:hypothetical protein
MPDPGNDERTHPWNRTQRQTGIRAITSFIRTNRRMAREPESVFEMILSNLCFVPLNPSLETEVD